MVAVMDLVPGALVHPRSSWVDPRYPITGPATPWADIDTAVIHYTAADDLIDGDPGEHAENLPAYFRAMNRAYWTQRTPPYALGYWWGVDWLGGIWQIRGWEFKSAANAGHNGHTGPILVLVDGNDGATPEAIHAIRCIIAEGERRARRKWAIKGHGQLRRETGVGTPTACCGIGLQAQVNAGVFSPTRPQPVPPVIRPPIPPIEDDDMVPTCIHEDTRLQGVFAWSGGRWVPWMHGRTPGVPFWSGDHEHIREQILHDQGPAAADEWRKRMKAS